MKILSIDGGGALGVGPLHMLSLAEANGVRLDTFDAFAGTSTGSIIATLLAAGVHATDILAMYRKELPVIFKKRARLPWRSKYSSEGLVSVLNKYMNPYQFRDIKKGLYIPYSDFQQKKVRVFDRLGNAETYLSFACQCSCSAPTYFPPVARRYADGGLLANNPALCAVVGAMREFDVRADDIQLVSLGTNGQTSTGFELEHDMGPVKWLKPLIGFTLQGNESLVDFQLRSMRLKNYVRFEPMLIRGFEMDDLDCLEDYMRIWETYYQDNIADVFRALL